MNNRFKVGDSVTFNYGYSAPGDALVGKVTHVKELVSPNDPEFDNQQLTVDWVVVVATTKEYAQDLKGVEAIQ